MERWLAAQLDPLPTRQLRELQGQEWSSDEVKEVQELLEELPQRQGAPVMVSRRRRLLALPPAAGTSSPLLRVCCLSSRSHASLLRAALERLIGQGSPAAADRGCPCPCAVRSPLARWPSSLDTSLTPTKSLLRSAWQWRPPPEQPGMAVPAATRRRQQQQHSSRGPG